MNLMILGKSFLSFRYSIKISFIGFIRLFEIPKSTEQPTATKDNIISWVHKEFKSNDINASKHRLLCKLDDMSNGKKRNLRERRISHWFLISSNDSQCFMP